MQPLTGEWPHQKKMSARKFVCGFCGSSVASDQGLPHTLGGSPDSNVGVWLCPLCERATFIEPGKQVPGVTYGDPVGSLPTDIETLYNEARRCCSTPAYTGAVLLLRKLLMNIAVGLGAKSGDTFVSYIEYLADKGYVPPNGKGWVDHIRKKSNEANHEITLMNKADAEELIIFSEMLLKFIYEFPKRVPQAPSP